MYVCLFFYLLSKEKDSKITGIFLQEIFFKQDKKTNQCFSRRRRSRTETDQDVVVVVDVGEDAAAGDGDADDVLSAFFRPSSSSRFSPPRPGLPKQDFIRTPPPPEKKKIFRQKNISVFVNDETGGRLQKLSNVLFSEWLEAKDSWCSMWPVL